jgi:diphosphomevalonate decarboxylase
MRAVKAQAPANIALVKYMGKADSVRNLPANGSLSVTLSGLRTVTRLGELSPRASAAGRLVAGDEALSAQELARAERHFHRVRERLPALFARFGLKLREASSEIEIRTENSFPKASGIASSASGFAALTLAGAALLCEETEKVSELLGNSVEFRSALAALSREGSGSSCRSFDGPFVVWEGERVRTSALGNLPPLRHLVLVVSSEKKAVPSSEAHQLVRSSPLWRDRPARANLRLREMETALARADLPRVAKLAWDEAWEMHSLFHTCEEPFSYWEPETLRALKQLAEGFENPPIVTLDAGPNVHLLASEETFSLWKERLAREFPDARILEDVPGRGAALI